MSQFHPAQKAAIGEAELRQFTGDLERYCRRLNRRVIYTPVVKFLADSAGAYWLLDAIAS